MKALFISSDPQIFSEESAVNKRMQEYADAIGTLHIILRAPGTESIEKVLGNLFIHGIPGGKANVLGKLASRAQELIASEEIEVVSAQDPFEHGWVAARAIRGTGAKLHLQVHTDFLSPWFVRSGVFRSAQIAMPVKNHVRRKIADQILPQAHGIRVVSERVKASLMARYGARIPEPVVIPIAVNREVPPPVELPQRPFTFTLITVSRLEPEKRIDDIIDALERVRDIYPFVGLVLVGEGGERAHLEELVVKKGLVGRVIFLGARPDAWGLMRSAQAYIQASAYEGYGITLIEAALARIPIITTDVGVVGEVFKGYDDLLSVPPGDPTALALSITAFLEDTAARDLMKRSAELKAQEHLSHYQNLPELIARDLRAVVSGSRTV